MAKHLLHFLFLIGIINLYHCRIVFDPNHHPELPKEDRPWLNDSDGDGIADSLLPYDDLPFCSPSKKILDCLDSVKQLINDLAFSPELKFNPESGTFRDEIHVKIAFSDSGIYTGPILHSLESLEPTKILYTTDSTVPSETNGDVYKDSILITANSVLKARINWGDGELDSVYTAKYIFQAKRPTATQDSGTYYQPITVALNCETGKTAISYTFDDVLKPSDSLTYFKDSLKITKTTTIKALAVRDGWNPSDTLVISYVINDTLKVSKPVFNPAGGAFLDSLLVGFLKVEKGAKIYYTENGKTPSKSDTLYKSAFHIHKSKTLKAITVDSYGKASEVAEAEFTINRTPVFKEIGKLSVDENKPLSFKISASDADGDSLTYSMRFSPVSDSRPSFDSSKQEFSWTPAYTNSGNYTAKFEVTDNGRPPGLDTLVVPIAVKHVNIDSPIVRLLLDSNGFSSVPVDGRICHYVDERISKLHLDSSRLGGQLTTLPAAVHGLTKLKTLILDNNKLTGLPGEIGKLQNLDSLVISRNRLSSLPPEIVNLTELIHLNVNHNNLCDLPDTVKSWIKNNSSKSDWDSTQFCPPICTPQNPHFTDLRDNKQYKCVTIGDQKWMAENLAYLPRVDDVSSGSDSWYIAAYYYVYGYTPRGANEEEEVSNAKATENYKTRGVLYNWHAAVSGTDSNSSSSSNIQGVCPDGWHLPSDEEFKALENAAGMTQVQADSIEWRGAPAGNNLRSTDWNGTDKLGFAALPAGIRKDGSFQMDSAIFILWSSTEVERIKFMAWYRHLSGFKEGVYRKANAKGNGYSVRCLQD